MPFASNDALCQSSVRTMKTLQPEVRDTLMVIGRSAMAGQAPNVADINSLRSRYAINKKEPGFWQRAAADLSDKELAFLVCGLAYVEAHLRWSGGSVSGVIWLFEALVARHASIDLLDEVAGWILANTNNPYNPFGTQISLGAKNYSEYRRLSSSRSVEIKRCIRADAKIEELANTERHSRKKMAAAGAVARHSEVRARIIESMKSLSLTEKLEKIAGDPTFPPQFFPTSIASAATQPVVDALPHEVRLELARRLKGKRRGPWRSFRRRLLCSLGPVWNKQPWRV